MGYMHIQNLYRNQEIMRQPECYALEKIHGTSAHIRWSTEKGLSFFSGGKKHERFAALFDSARLAAALASLPFKEIIVYGEAYGGKQQGMSKTYGPDLKFAAFDVEIEGQFQEVPKAHSVCLFLGLDFVSWAKVSTKIEVLDAERDMPSIQAIRNGMGEDRIREGIVLRPLVEGTDFRGNRIIAKHKRPEFRETKTVREVDPEHQARIVYSHALAEEWVTEMRLGHVLDKIGNPTELSSIPAVIAATIEDVIRESAGEVEDTKDNRKALGARTVKMYKDRVCKIPA